jgi:hypothetical protein
MRRSTLITLLVSLVGVFIDASPAAAATTSPLQRQVNASHDQDTWNTVETYGSCYNNVTFGTCTDAYDGVGLTTGGWDDLCYQPDCGQIVVTPKGVSAQKRSDLAFIVGYDSYDYNNPVTGTSIYISGTFTDSQVLPFFKKVTFDGATYRLQLTSASAYYDRYDLPLQTFQICTVALPCADGSGGK